MSAIYNSTMSYSSKSYLDTLGSISLLNSLQVGAPTPTTTATTLDVDNTDLSVSMMLNVLDSFNTNQLNSYNIATLLVPNLNLTITNKNIVLFSTPLSSSIQKSDIKYYISTSSTFLGGKSPSLSDESFQKINTLVNEIFLMKPELTIYNQAQTKFPIFTFTEILRDTDGVNSYLCSIRVIFYNSTFYTSDPTFPNALYFVISYLNVNNMVKLPSFNNVLSQISSTKRLLNFSVVVLRNLNTVDVQTFSNYIAASNFKNRFGGNGIYIFYYKLNSDTYTKVLKPYNELTSYDTVLLHEQNHQWAGVDSKYLFASENDLIVSQATYNIYKSLMNYFEFRKDMQFGVNYKWNYGQKHSSCMLFDITKNGFTTTYMIGCGVNLETFIPISIKSTGDTLLSGDFNIKDINDNSIFQISNSEKKITSAYKVGVGKDQPQTTMDIEDTSMASILSVIDKISNTLFIIDKNKQTLSTANLSTNSSIEDAISSLRNKDNTSLKDIQTPFYYASIYKINNDYNVGNQSVIYNWLFGNSDNKIWNNSSSTMLPKKLSELPSSKQLDFLSNYMLGLLTTKFIIPNTTVSNIYNWVYGKKLAFTSFFTNNSSVYCFVLGIDLQQYNLRYNTNDNIEKLFLCIDTYQSLLQVITNHIPTDISGIPLSQYIQATEKLKNNLSLYGNPIIRKYTISSTNSVETAKNIDYTKNTSTLKDMTELFNKPLTYDTLININSISDTNSYIMYQSLINRINSQYSSLSFGQNGIVWFEDSKEYYVSIFYCTLSSISTKTIISIEFPLDTFIIPTLTVKGDTRVNGELSTRVLNQSSNFTTIDPDRNFIGFGTDERELYYSYLTPNTKSPFFYVSNANSDIDYPCAVFDRSDVNDSSPISTIINVKRTLTQTSIPNGAGLDIGFEFTRNSYTQRLGSIGMTIENDFFINKTSGNNDTNLMYISRDGKLSVNSLLLPTTFINSTSALADLGSSSFGTVNVSISNPSTITYKGGVINGTYIVKVKLNNNTINIADGEHVFNFVNNNKSPSTYAIIKVNVLSDNGTDNLYFTNITYY